MLAQNLVANAPDTKAQLLKNICPLWRAICDEKPLKQDSIIEFASTFWRPNTKRLLERSEYLTFLKCILSREREFNVFFVIGTPGIGKSLFGLWLMYALTEDMMATEQRRPTFVYKTLDGDVFLNTDGQATTTIPNDEIDFVISDSCPRCSVEYRKYIHISSIGSQYLDDVKTSFKDVPLKLELPMDVFSYEECLMLKHCYGNQFLPRNDGELNAIYLIFGGIARRFTSMVYSYRPGVRYYNMVFDELRELFNDQTDVVVGKSFLELCANIISNDLEKGRDVKHRVVMSSMFIHQKMDSEQKQMKNSPASVFMEILARRIREDADETIQKALVAVIGSAGMGFSFEYLSHNLIFSNLKNRLSYNLESLPAEGSKKKNKKNENKIIDDQVLQLNQIQKRFIGSIDDLRSLQPGDYAILWIPNFPLVDAVIVPPDDCDISAVILLQMTIGKTHQGATNKLVEIQEKLSHLSEDIWMVYILDNQNYDPFRGENELKLPQFKTRPYLTSEKKQKKQKTK
jgi:hypothetical protein